MSGALSFLFDLISNPLSILFVIQIITIGMLVMMNRHNAERMALSDKHASDKFKVAQDFSKERLVAVQNQLNTLKKEYKEIIDRYHLLNNMVEKVALFIEPIIKRKLIKQAPGKEWTANNPLSGD